MWPWIFGTVSALVAGGVSVTALGLRFARQIEQQTDCDVSCHWVHTGFNARCDQELNHEGPHRVDGKWYPRKP